MNEMLKALYDSFYEMAAQLQGQLDTIDTEEQKSKTSVLQVDKIRKALEKELSFEDGVNSRLVASILDKIIVKRESTKEEIHLDIYLKMGQIYETVYQPQKSSSKDNPLRRAKLITNYKKEKTGDLNAELRPPNMSNTKSYH